MKKSNLENVEIIEKIEKIINESIDAISRVEESEVQCPEEISEVGNALAGAGFLSNLLKEKLSEEE